MTEKQIETVLSGSRNLFFTGPAGTGKSYWMNRAIASFESQGLHVVTCASTGIAALLLHGDTAHRVFHIPVGTSPQGPSFAKGKKGALTKSMLNVLIAADVVILDEVSMLKNADFAWAVKVLRKAEKYKEKKIRMIVSGDFSQLLPVVTKADASVLKKFGFDESGLAFTTSEWKSMNFKVLELTDIYRQSDAEFIGHLHDIRAGKVNTLRYFDRFVTGQPDEEDAVYICGTNAEADRINRAYLDTLPGQPSALLSEKTGRCSSGMVEDVVVIKPGARVIFMANDVKGNTYCNGQFGTVTAIGADQVIVEMDGKPVVIKRHEFHIYAYTATGGTLSKKELGCIRQYPFKLGKAITIHKSQGQTFDKVILSPKIFAEGQLYVALSRVHTPEGLQLTEKIDPASVMISDKVCKFYRDGFVWKAVKTRTVAKTKPSPAKKTVSGKKPAAKKPPVKRKAVKPRSKKA